MLLRNVKYALRRVKCLRARVDFISHFAAVKYFT